MTTPLSPQAQKMLDEITELIADKELKFGCEVEFKYMIGLCRSVHIIHRKRGRRYYLVGGGSGFYKSDFDRILGTPPDFCRVLLWFDKNYKEEDYKAGFLIELLGLWDFSQSLLRDQSEELITSLHPLFFGRGTL